MKPLTVRYFGLTDAGKVRPGNEDQFLVAVMRKAMLIEQTSLAQARTQYADEQGHLFLVADGMGGHEGGEEASALTIETIQEFALNTLKWFFHLGGAEEQDVLTEFQQALRRADARVFAEAAEHPELRGMGTTVTLAYSLMDQLFIAHVGDSRCYLLRGGELYQLTQDHTLVEELVRHGTVPAEQARRHQLRHVITNAVGGPNRGIRVDAHKVDLEAGDCVLLCTDGLTEMVADDQIAAVLQAEPDPQRACERLVAQANALGGEDNVTAVVVRYSAP